MNFLQHLEMTQGDNVTFQLGAKNTQQKVYDLTGGTLMWRVASRLGSGYVINKPGVIVDAVNGLWTVTLIPSDTNNLVINYTLVNQWWQNSTPQVDFVHEGVFTDAGGLIHTCVQGRFRVNPCIMQPN